MYSPGADIYVLLLRVVLGQIDDGVGKVVNMEGTRGVASPFPAQ
jgi:hypothetical protein